LVDLCAAPGGWLQVASKYMPISSIKIGIDLDPIKEVKGCSTFEADITTPKCISIIRRELKHFEADVVLNDGAPNVGAQWNKDAYGQAELVLASLKVATQVLKKGGVFVTKVFRSKDYNSLVWVLNFFFDKVEVSKPAASRAQSAEIFFVCLGYKKPDTIDPKFLDPKHVFEDIAAEEEDSSKKINSLKKLLEGTRNRQGYDTDGSGAFYKETTFSEFMKCREPYKYLSTYNKMKIDDVCKNEIFTVVKPPNSLPAILEDIKVLGRSDLALLLKYRSKYQRQCDKKRAQARKDLEEQKIKDMTPEELEKQNEDELNQRLEQKQKEAMKKVRKNNEIQKKSEYLQKMSVMTSITVQNNDDELDLDAKTFAQLQDIENLDDLHPAEGYSSDDLDEEAKRERAKHMEYDDMVNDNESELDEYDSDYEHKLVDKMDEEITQRHKDHKEYQMKKETDDKEEILHKKKLTKGKRNLEMQMEHANQLAIKKYNNNDVKDYESDDSMSDDELAAIRAIELKNKKRVKTTETEEFVNPLVATKKDIKKLSKKEKESDASGSDKEEFDSDAEELADKLDKEKQKEKEKKDKKKRDRKRKDKDKEEEVNDFEVVKADKTYSDYDSDDIAEIRAIGKKMLRKKDRLELIDDAYSKYAFKEDPATLPAWFAEDENKYNKPIPSVTKEEVKAEKKWLKEYNARPSAKVAEFKERKKRRMLRAMAKVRQKATQIANSDEINNQSKMREIKKLYSKEKRKIDQKQKKKDTVVGRNFSASAPGKTRGHKYKMVDRRLKKDTRSMKRAEKKSKKTGGGKRIKIKK